MTRKHSLKYIIEKFESQGYKLITENYKNARKQKLDYICPKGHKGSTTYGNFYKGQRCFECFGNKKYTIEKLQKIFLTRNCELLTSKYINAKQKLEYICPEDHVTTTIIDNFNRGYGCKYCQADKTSHNSKLDPEFVKLFFQKNDYKLIDKYESAHKKMNCICPKGHVIKVKYSNFYSGRRCGECRIFQTEELCRKTLEKIFKKKFIKTRPKWLKRLELDCYNEELKIALEYNGMQHYEFVPYFHKNKIENFYKQQERDSLKIELCKNKGIELCIVPYYIKDIETFIYEHFYLYALSIK